jgi:polyphenol oxidase
MERITDEIELQRAGFYWREIDGVRVLVCAPLEQDGFTNGFSTRRGGVSPMPHDALNLAGFNDDAAENILENRRRFLKLFAGRWTLTGCWQDHGAEVRVVKNWADAKGSSNRRGDEIHCDALVSNAPGVLIGVKTADCVPILIGDQRTGAFAAVHAGWRGTLDAIVIHALERLANVYGTRAEDVRAAIGPAAGACCYEVGDDVIRAFKARCPESKCLFTPTREGHARIDLFKANRDQLISLGVAQDRIHTSPLCTMCRTDLFFSYRREKKLQGRVGRLMSVIGRRTP